MFKELYASYEECLRRKANTKNAIEFTIDKERKLLELVDTLKNRKYIPGKSIYFIVHKPKEREVFAADFRDRIIHHFFIRAIEKSFYADMTENVYSCVKNRGVHNCISIIKKTYPKYKYYLQIDIRSFFMSIDKNILKEKVRKYLPKVKYEHISTSVDFDLSIYSYLLDVLLDFDPITNCEFRKGPKDKTIIYDKNVGYIKNNKLILPKHKSLFGCKSGVGMPIGNYTSQFFANIYLNDLDKYVLDALGVKDYFRYVDDLVLFGNNCNDLRNMIEKINTYLKDNLNMTLAENKTKLKQIIHGLDFLGYFIKPYTTYSRQRVKNTFAYRLEALEKQMITYKNLKDKIVKVISFERGALLNLQSVCASYIGHLKYADSINLRHKLFYKFSFLQHYFTSSFNIIEHTRWKKKEKNNYLVYKYYNNIFGNMLIFFKLDEYYIFRKKDLEILKNISSNILNSLGVKFYKNIGFKVHKDKAKTFLVYLIENTNKSIVLLDKVGKFYLKYIYINS